MNKKERASIEKRAEELKGRRSVRTIDADEIDKMAEMDRKRSLAGKTIRVYSFDGFVSNSYANKHFSVKIDFIQREYDVEGKKMFIVGQCGAGRSYGGGSLVTVNNRSYE